MARLVQEESHLRDFQDIYKQTTLSFRSSGRKILQLDRHCPLELSKAADLFW